MATEPPVVTLSPDPNTTLLTTMFDNVSKTPTYSSTCKLDGAKISIIACYIMLFCVGTVGNTLVIISFLNKRKRGSTIDLLIIYLAFFDLLASIFTPFIFGYWSWTCDLRWDFGWFGCKVLSLATRLFTTVSIGILLIMAIDRYRIIVTPLKQRFLRWHIHMAVAFTVVLAFLSELHYISALHLEENGQCAVYGTNTYIYGLVSITLFRDTAFVTIFISTTIGVLLRLYGKSFKEISRAQSNTKLRQRQKKTVAKMIVVMATVFALTVIPRDLFQITLVIRLLQGNPIKYSYEVLLVNNVLKLLQTSNSVYNVFIYARMTDSFFTNLRRKFSKSLRKRFSSANSTTKMDKLDLCENDSMLRNSSIRNSEVDTCMGPS